MAAPPVRKNCVDYMDDNMPGWRVDHHSGKPRSTKGKEKLVNAGSGNTSDSDSEKKKKSIESRNDPSRAQEYSDAKRLHVWKCHVRESDAPAVFDFLDKRMPLWRSTGFPNRKKVITPVAKARDIFRRCQSRGGSLPRLIPSCEQSTPDLVLEHSDAMQLREWKNSYVENPECLSEELRFFLTSSLKLWQQDNAVANNFSSDFSLNKRKRDYEIDFNDMEPDMTTGTSFYESSAVVSLSPRKMSMTNSTMRDAPYAYRSGNTDAVNALLKLSSPAAGFKLVSGTSAADRLHENSYLQSTSHYQPVSFNFLPVYGRKLWQGSKPMTNAIPL